MKYIERILGVCEGCGAREPTQRDVAVMPTGDEARHIHTPKEWSCVNVEPGVRIVGVDKPFNAFGNPVDVATHFGKAVQIMLCPTCSKLHVEAEAAKRELLQ